jgi:HSP20 family protein
MSITPRHGRSELETMRERLDRLLSEFGGRTWELLDRGMPVDVQETDNEVVVKASVPGVKPENLDIHCAEGMLTIRATVEETKEEQEGTWHIKEMRTGKTERSITLPGTADIDRADASLENGVLRITFPIAEAAAKRRIQVKSTGTGTQQ